VTVAGRSPAVERRTAGSVGDGVTLRVFTHVDRMQPQYAAYWGLMSQGALPIAGASQLLVEVSPSNAVFPLTDVAMKATQVRSSGTLIERDFGLLELHAPTPDPVEEAGRVILAALGATRRDRLAPRIVSSQRLSNITDYHSQLFNKIRRGAWTLPGDTLFVLEVTPAAYVYQLANEIEKAVAVELVRVAGTGLYGRLIVAGTDAQTASAEEVALALVAATGAEATDARPEEGTRR
jgi:hypothetical protein